MPATLASLEIDLVPIPDSLKKLPGWGYWRYVQTDRPKPEKQPFYPAGYPAKPNHPDDWGTFTEAVAAYEDSTRQADGLAFVFSPANKVCGIDLDHCRDKETGRIESWAVQLVRRIASYTEVSPSGTGLHILTLAELKRKGQRKEPLEIYDGAVEGSGRYFTITGQHVKGTSAEIMERQGQVTAFNHALKPIATLLTTPEKRLSFERLFIGDTSAYNDDDSRADLALCSMAAWAGASAYQIHCLMCLSGLYRQKWSREDYRERTITQALTLTGNEPQPVSPEPPQQLRTPQWCGVVRKLSAIPLRQPAWLWKPMLPRGFLAILAGDGGTGKSTVASLIAARLTRGEHPYTGIADRAPENVIIATSEDDHAMMLKPRMLAYNADQERILTVMPVPPVQDPEGWKTLIETHRPALIIIDPLQEALGGKLDENRASQTRAALRPLLPLVETYNCTFLFLAHLGKDASEKKAQHRILGSVDIGAVMRSIMIIEESEPAGHYTISQVKNNLTGKATTLAYHIVPHTIQPGWEVGIAKWEENPIPGYATKQEEGAELARAYVQALGEVCERDALLTHLGNYGITGGTANRAIQDAGLTRTGGKIALSKDPKQNG